MQKNIQRELKCINSKILKLKSFGYLGTIFLGIGIYILIVDDDGVFHPMLNETFVIFSFLLLGAIISAYEIYLLPKLKKNKSLLTEKLNNENY